MKLLRYGRSGHEKPGLLDRDGVVRDLSRELPDLTPERLGAESLRGLAKLDPKTLPVVAGERRLGGVPVAGIRKFIAVGLNYADHAAEAGLPVPQEPVLFTKAISCLTGPNDDVMLPKGSRKSDWEVELGVVSGSVARYVKEADALSYVAGYCVVNDGREREYQIERGGTWDKGKGCDTFGPVGPWLVTPDEVGDPQSLKLWLELNGRRRHSGNTRTMIFSVAKLIGYISRFITLEPGDLVTTGTPPGVSMGVKPEPVFLRPGDLMRLGVKRLGEQTQRVVAWSDH
jgi:2,4-didehydro-3-deoxy-L-rhamnonate hydrolase